MENWKEDIDKLRFHIRMLIQGLEIKEFPLQNLVVTLNWSEDDLEDAYDIFDEFFEYLSKSPELNPKSFEYKLKDRFQIDTLGVNQIILAFYHAGRWKNICKWYAKNYDVIELQEIITQ